MRKIRVYVDTSVFGGVGDEEFAIASRRFFERIHDGEFIILISQVTVDELRGAPERVQKVFDDLPDDSVVFVPTDPEATALAQSYIDANILGKSSLDDAIHVATATVSGADMILSWNFRHIVNYDRIHKYNGVNALMGYSPIEIHSPLEISDANENENF
jgi:predicted nucleic acid-binding protein